jgi:hypothetical protein
MENYATFVQCTHKKGSLETKLFLLWLFNPELHTTLDKDMMHRPLFYINVSQMFSFNLTGGSWTNSILYELYRLLYLKYKTEIQTT